MFLFPSDKVEESSEENANMESHPAGGGGGGASTPEEEEEETTTHNTLQHTCGTGEERLERPHVSTWWR